MNSGDWEVGGVAVSNSPNAGSAQQAQLGRPLQTALVTIGSAGQTLMVFIALEDLSQHTTKRAWHHHLGRHTAGVTDWKKLNNIP